MPAENHMDMLQAMTHWPFCPDHISPIRVTTHRLTIMVLFLRIRIWGLRAEPKAHLSSLTGLYSTVTNCNPPPPTEKNTFKPETMKARLSTLHLTRDFLCTTRKKVRS